MLLFAVIDNVTAAILIGICDEFFDDVTLGAISRLLLKGSGMGVRFETCADVIVVVIIAAAKAAVVIKVTAFESAVRRCFSPFSSPVLKPNLQQHSKQINNSWTIFPYGWHNLPMNNQFLMTYRDSKLVIDAQFW